MCVHFACFHVDDFQKIERIASLSVEISGRDRRIAASASECGRFCYVSVTCYQGETWFYKITDKQNCKTITAVDSNFYYTYKLFIVSRQVRILIIIILLYVNNLSIPYLNIQYVNLTEIYERMMKS